MEIKKDSNDLAKIYDDLKTIKTLHKIKQEALYHCYDENVDYRHVFVLDDIYAKKLDDVLGEFERIFGLSLLKCL